MLAHLFIDFLLDPANAEQNFAWIGYQPPMKGLDADYLIATGYVPENLRRRRSSTRRTDRQGLPAPAARRRARPALGGRLVEVHRRVVTVRTGRPARAPRPGRAAVVLRPLRWRCPARSGCWRLFVVPFYAILAVAFGGIDPILRTAEPSWNPLDWDFAAIRDVARATSSAATSAASSSAPVCTSLSRWRCAS